MSNIHIQYYKTNIGELILGSFEKQLCLLDYRHRKKRATVDQRLKRKTNSDFIEQDDSTLRQVRGEIEEYLQGSRTTFDTPILMLGTDFQEAVWKALIKIPYGKTSSYLQLAKSIDNEKAVRAVAGANGANAISIIIPCHRIIGSNGELVGYSGGLPAKKNLLKLESYLIQHQNV